LASTRVWLADRRGTVAEGRRPAAFLVKAERGAGTWGLGRRGRLALDAE